MDESRQAAAFDSVCVGEFSTICLLFFVVLIFFCFHVIETIINLLMRKSNRLLPILLSLTWIVELEEVWIFQRKARKIKEKVSLVLQLPAET